MLLKLPVFYFCLFYLNVDYYHGEFGEFHYKRTFSFSKVIPHLAECLAALFDRKTWKFWVEISNILQF